MILGLILAAVIIGALMPVQAAINAELTRFVRHPFLGAFISFFIGTIALMLIIAVRGLPWDAIKRVPEASPWLFVGGILGALFVGASIYLIPKMGATTMIAAFITGQLLMSVLIDHMGLLGVPVQAINLQRIIGICLLFTGLFLVVRRFP